MAPYVKNYYLALDSYVFALTFTKGNLRDLKEKLASLPAGLGAELHRRADALFKAQETLKGIYEQLEQSPFFAWEPVAAAAYEFHGLAEGFGGLGIQLHDFSHLVDNRSREYDDDIKRIDDQSQKIADTHGLLFR